MDEKVLKGLGWGKGIITRMALKCSFCFSCLGRSWRGDAGGTVNALDVAVNKRR